MAGSRQWCHQAKPGLSRNRRGGSRNGLHRSGGQKQRSQCRLDSTRSLIERRCALPWAGIRHPLVTSNLQLSCVLKAHMTSSGVRILVLHGKKTLGVDGCPPCSFTSTPCEEDAPSHYSAASVACRFSPFCRQTGHLGDLRTALFVPASRMLGATLCPMLKAFDSGTNPRASGAAPTLRLV